MELLIKTDELSSSCAKVLAEKPEWCESGFWGAPIFPLKFENLVQEFFLPLSNFEPQGEIFLSFAIGVIDHEGKANTTWTESHFPLETFDMQCYFSGAKVEQKNGCDWVNFEDLAWFNEDFLDLSLGYYIQNRL